MSYCGVRCCRYCNIVLYTAVVVTRLASNYNQYIVCTALRVTATVAMRIYIAHYLAALCVLAVLIHTPNFQHYILFTVLWCHVWGLHCTGRYHSKGIRTCVWRS